VRGRGFAYAARDATTSTGTASLKLNRDPLGSQFLNDSAEALAAGPRLSSSGVRSLSMGSAVTAARLAATMVLGGCVALGWRFGPGFSAADKAVFAKPPVVVDRGDEFFLAWTQGSSPFFFRPDYRVKDGRLVFALVSTSSSGSLAGRPQEMKIEGTENILALQRGGAYWWEPEPSPGGRLLPLRIVRQFAAPPPTPPNRWHRQSQIEQ
jgi:hypothetical protein